MMTAMGHAGGRTTAVRLAAWWLALLATASLAGWLVVHAGHGYALSHLDAVVQRDIQPVHPDLHHLASVVTVLGSLPVVLGCTAAFAFAANRITGAPVLILVVVTLGAVALSDLAKLIVRRTGPAHRVASGLHDYSFPSGHSTSAGALFVGAALIATVGSRWRRLAAITATLVLASGVAWSRVVLDVHWLTDVLAPDLAHLILVPLVGHCVCWPAGV